MSGKASQFEDNPTVSEQQGIRYLHFDSPWIQGAMDLKRPDRLVLSYTEQMMAWLLFFRTRQAGGDWPIRAWSGIRDEILLPALAQPFGCGRAQSISDTSVRAVL